jgi:hypothetical protein
MTTPALTTLSPEIAAAAGSLTVSDLECFGRIGAGPELLEPTAPYLRPILEIHRGPDGFVTFHRKHGEELENLGSVPIAELKSIFPEFAAELERDSYFSINSFYRAGYCGPHLPMMKPAHRLAKDARYLNACFVDIDFHDQPGPLDFGYQFGQVITLQEKRIIPPASLVMRSGRGLWLFWLLASPQNPLLPPSAFPEKVLAFNAIEHELIRRTNADSAARDVARITRVPGSINTKAGDTLRVMYWTQRDVNGRAYVYTLESLANFLGVELPRLRPTRQAAEPRPKASECALRGWSALWKQRFDDFETLRRMRGGFSEGCRNHAAYIYGVILRGNGLNDAAIRQAVTILGRECRQPLSEEAIKGAIHQSGESRRQIKDSTIAGYLRVTPEEARIIPRWADSKIQHRIDPVDMNLRPAQRKLFRYTAIAEIVRSLDGRLPSGRKMAELLQQRGIQTSHVQVLTDYQRLQLSPREPILPLFSVKDLTLVEGGDGGRDSLPVFKGGKLAVRSVQPAEAYQGQEDYQVVS